MHRTQNIFLVGPFAAGKTTIGKKLAQQLNMEFYDTDQVIIDRSGVDILWIFDLEGEEKFRERESKIIEELSQKQGIVLATGGGSVLHPRSRNWLASRGFVIYLQPSVAQQLQRTRYCRRRPHIQVANKEPILDQMSKEEDPFYLEIADYCYAMEAEMSVSSVVEHLVQVIRQKA